MTLKGGKQADYETAFLMLKRQITDEYNRHLFILRDERLAEQKERYLESMRGKAADKFKYLDKVADEALLQIEERKYVQELEDDGYENVYCYGIAFCGKDCLVKLASADNHN